MHVSKPRHRQDERRGAALVELAITLPILVMITLGSIEASNAIAVKQALTEAAYEGARAATARGATQADAQTKATEILTARNISGGTISVTPAITTNTAAGTIITVTVNAPSNSNMVTPTFYMGNITVRAAVAMVRQP